MACETIDGVAHDVAGGFPAVDDVVDELVLAAHLGVARDVVGEQALDDAEAAPLRERHQPAGAVAEAVQPLADDRVLDRDVVEELPAVRVDIERAVDAPRDRHVVEDHVRAVRSGWRLPAAGVALADGEVAADEVMGVGEADLVAVDEIPPGAVWPAIVTLLSTNDAGDVDDPTDIEHDEPVRRADRVAERAGAGIVQVGDVIDAGAGEIGPRAVANRPNPSASGKAFC